MGRRQFALALGYNGTNETNWLVIRRYETGQKPIPPLVGRMAWLLLQFKSNAHIPLDESRAPVWPEGLV